MIPIKAYEDYNEINELTCWHCKKNIYKNEQNIQIIHNVPLKLYNDTILHFHTDCFKSIAGQEYVVEMRPDLNNLPENNWKFKSPLEHKMKAKIPKYNIYTDGQIDKLIYSVDYVGTDTKPKK